MRQEILDNHFKLVSNYTGSFRHLNSLRGGKSWSLAVIKETLNK